MGVVDTAVEDGDRDAGPVETGIPVVNGRRADVGNRLAEVVGVVDDRGDRDDRWVIREGRQVRRVNLEHDRVPYIGATAVHERGFGFDGTGVTVAVLDSGIDYTHAAFGGPGTATAYNNAYGANACRRNKEEPDWNAIDDDTNIVGGFDFVGEDWPFGALAPDPDPINQEARMSTPTSRMSCSAMAGTAPTWRTSSAVAAFTSRCTRSRCARPSPPPAAASPCSSAWITPSTRTPTGSPMTASTSSTFLGSDYGQAFDDDLSQAVENATDVGRTDRRRRRN